MNSPPTPVRDQLRAEAQFCAATSPRSGYGKSEQLLICPPSNKRKRTDTRSYGEDDSFYVPRFAAPLGITHATLDPDIKANAQYVPRTEMTYKVRLKDGTTKEVPLPRDKSIMANALKAIVYLCYRYDNVLRKTHPICPLVQQVLALLESVGLHCNHCIANAYQVPKDHIGWHDDKSRDFAKDSSVCTVSYGGSRWLLLKHREGKKPDQRILLEDQSLFVLGPKTNGAWLHCIEQGTGSGGPRISLTCRAITTTWNSETSVITERAIDVPPHAFTPPQPVVDGTSYRPPAGMARFLEKKPRATPVEAVNVYRQHAIVHVPAGAENPEAVRCGDFTIDEAFVRELFGDTGDDWMRRAVFVLFTACDSGEIYTLTQFNDYQRRFRPQWPELYRRGEAHQGDADFHHPGRVEFRDGKKVTASLPLPNEYALGPEVPDAGSPCAYRLSDAIVNLVNRRTAVMVHARCADGTEHEVLFVRADDSSYGRYYRVRNLFSLAEEGDYEHATLQAAWDLYVAAGPRVIDVAPPDPVNRLPLSLAAHLCQHGEIILPVPGCFYREARLKYVLEASAPAYTVEYWDGCGPGEVDVIPGMRLPDQVLLTPHFPVYSSSLLQEAWDQFMAAGEASSKPEPHRLLPLSQWLWNDIIVLDLYKR